ncbi:SAM-dependent methyltransferase [Streptomyces sp. TRM43335]|uniref:SAM-dependent methyltransferase n=1 Tax=Streptomyces taklimakanensis TaxID=2569853 RepID=A0A6G2BHC0_9ACTN|nr:SAM-dependent methyltransferase [Streptomyces taklimakanensis]MTE21604.1 SAM-dependent methyltransferase [Streptomyces taklimakanensis]
MNATSRTGGDTWEGVWNTDPAITAAVHLPIFEEYVDPDLPLVDVDCGSGARTVFLAGRFHPCVGIDRSAEALERARTVVGEGAGGRSAPDFRQLDAADPDAMRRLHDELGDTNVYLRGVLQRSEPDDRSRVAESVAALVGGRGRAFVVEATPTARAALARGAGAESAGDLPGPLDAPGLSDLARLSEPPAPSGGPAGREADRAGDARPEDPAAPFAAAGLRVIAGGALPLSTTDFEPDGSRLDLPATWLVVGR